MIMDFFSSPVIITLLPMQGEGSTKIPWAKQHSQKKKKRPRKHDHETYLRQGLTFQIIFHMQIIIRMEWWKASKPGAGEGEVAQSCLILCDPMNCNLLGFSVHGILQARILEWI